MKKNTLTLLVLFFVVGAKAQVENPVTWSYSAKKISADVYELHMTATMQPKWHIYSQDLKGDGPVPTSFAFDKNPLIKTDGVVAEVGKLQQEYNKDFKMNVKYYANKVDFVQKIKLKALATTMAKGQVTYMVCDDKKCLPPKDVAFAIKINPKG
jgi:Disulphide bond corrector protein DsbC